MAPTPYLAQLPYVRRLLASLDSVIGRTRLMRIEEEGELTSHIDTNYYWRDHLRVHFPVRTTPDVRFECDGEQVHMAAGRGLGVRHLASAPRREPVAHAAHPSRRRHRRGRGPVAPHRPSRRRAVRRRGRRSGARARHRAGEPAVGDDALGARARPRSAPARARRVPIRRSRPRSTSPSSSSCARGASAWARFGDDADGREHFTALRRRGRRHVRRRRGRRAAAERCARDRGDAPARAPRRGRSETRTPPTAAPTRAVRAAPPSRASTARCSWCRRRGRAARCCSRRSPVRAISSPSAARAIA